MLAAKTNVTVVEAKQEADGAASAEAVVEEAERLAAKEEATLSTSGNSASAAEDDASSDVDTSVRKQASIAKSVVAVKKSTPSVAAKWQKGAQAHTGPRVRVMIMSARGLKGSLAGGVTSMGITDPYCVCEVLHKPHVRLQTLAIDGINGAHWNHAGSLASFVASDTLRFSIYEHDALKDQRLLGSADLPIWRVGKGGFRGELPVAGAGKDGESAFLKLVVKREGSGWDAAAWDRELQEAREAAQEAQEDEEATEDAADAEDDDEADDDDDDSKDVHPVSKASQPRPVAAKDHARHWYFVLGPQITLKITTRPKRYHQNGHYHRSNPCSRRRSRS